MAGQDLSRYYCCVNDGGCVEFWTRDTPGDVARDVEDAIGAAKSRYGGEFRCVFVLRVDHDRSLHFVHADRFLASATEFSGARLEEPARQYAGPCEQCEEDGDTMPLRGVLWKHGGREVQRCDACQRYDSDLDAALAVARTFNLFGTLVPDGIPDEPWVGTAVVMPFAEAVKVDFNPDDTSDPEFATPETTRPDLDAFKYPILGDHLERTFFVRCAVAVSIGGRVDSAEDLKIAIAENFWEHPAIADRQADLDITGHTADRASGLPPAPGDLVTHRYHFVTSAAATAFRNGVEAAGGQTGPIIWHGGDSSTVDLERPVTAVDVVSYGIVHHR